MPSIILTSRPSIKPRRVSITRKTKNAGYRVQITKEKKTKINARCLMWLLVVLWMLTIFLFSAQPADTSNEQSGFIAKFIARIVVPDYPSFSAVAQQDAASRYQHVVRKCGHATEYAVLGALLFAALWQTFKGQNGQGAKGWNRQGIRIGGIAWGLCVIYASTDEFHQLFVTGRSCQGTDVLIDACGALIGIAVSSFLTRVLMEKRARRSRGL